MFVLCIDQMLGMPNDLQLFTSVGLMEINPE